MDKNGEAPKLQVAAKAIIANGVGQVLVVRESAGHSTNTKAGQYQLPGGRLEPGETFLDGLRREALEETGLAIDAIAPFELGEWHPVIQGVPHQIIAVFMHCKLQTPENTSVHLSQEHDAFMWVDGENRQDCNLMAPDDTVIDKYLAHAANSRAEGRAA